MVCIVNKFQFDCIQDSAKIKEDQTDCADSGATCDAGASKDVHAEPTELPFQIQIYYTDLEGAQAMRVLTQTKPVTKERSQAEDCERTYLYRFSASFIIAVNRI